MRKNILLDPGILPFLPLKDSICDFLTNNKLTVINDNPRKNNWDQIGTKCELISYNQLSNFENSENRVLEFNNYTELLKYIINDHRTLLIYERVNKIFAWKSLFNGIQDIEILIYNSLQLLLRINPDSILFQATPHNLPSWILAKTGEFLGLKINMIQTSPLPWRFRIVEGLDEQYQIFPEKKINVQREDLDIFRYFWKMNTSDYKNALPSYEKKRLHERGGKYWSWKKEIIDSIKNPKKFLFIFPKLKLYKTYRSLSKSPDYSQNYVVYFLHYQPERTSMPEGGFYSQQWLIIKQLSLSLPTHWKLYVKEHPSTFTGKYDIKYRSPDFYKIISELPNVSLIQIGTNTFDLIDSSKFIATITGTVGVQSLMRGKPVIVFGYSNFRCFKNGVHYVQSLSELESIFKNEINNCEIKEEEVFKFLLENNYYSISGINHLKNLDIYSTITRMNGHTNLLSIYFHDL